MTALRAGATTLALAVVLAATACMDNILAPRPGVDYALESIDGAALPQVMLSDYDIVVTVLSDRIRLHPDSTFTEIAEFRGTAADATILAADTLTGTWTVSGQTMTFLLPGAAVNRMTIEGDALVQGTRRRFVYRRR